MREIEYAVCKKNLAVVNVTQCNQGMVEMGLYDASASLARIGVISGVDMTPEAALVKMMFWLGQGYDIETVKDQMQKDMRGEQSVNVFNFVYENGTASPICKTLPRQLPANFVREDVVRAHVRLDNVSLPLESSEGKIELAVYLNHPDVGVETSVEIPHCIGMLEGNYTGQDLNMILDCTKKVLQIVKPGVPMHISIVSRNSAKVSWKGMLLSVFTSVRQ